MLYSCTYLATVGIKRLKPENKSSDSFSLNVFFYEMCWLC